MKLTLIMWVSAFLLTASPFNCTGQASLPPDLFSLNASFSGQYISHGLFSDIPALESFKKPSKFSLGVNIGFTFTIQSVLIKMQSRKSGFINPRKLEKPMHLAYESSATDVLVGYRFKRGTKWSWSPVVGMSSQVQRYSVIVNEVSSQNLNQYINTSGHRNFIYTGYNVTAGFLVDWSLASESQSESMGRSKSWNFGESLVPSVNVQMLSQFLPFNSQWTTPSGQKLTSADHQDFSFTLMLGFSLHLAPSLFQR